MKIIKAISLFSLIFLIFSCITMSTGNKKKSDFSFINKDINFENGTICVIPGIGSKVSKYLSKEIIKNLKTNSSLLVKDYSYADNIILLDQNFIKMQKINNYDLSDEELFNLAKNQKLLKCDFIYLVWINNLTKIEVGGTAKYKADVIGCLIKYPENKQIGYTKNIFINTAKNTYFNKANDNKEVENLLKNASLSISKEFIKETNSYNIKQP